MVLVGLGMSLGHVRAKNESSLLASLWFWRGTGHRGHRLDFHRPLGSSLRESLARRGMQGVGSGE